MSAIDLSPISNSQQSSAATLIRQAQSPTADAFQPQAEVDQVQLSNTARQLSQEESPRADTTYSVRVASSAGGQSASTGLTREDAIALYREVSALL